MAAEENQKYVALHLQNAGTDIMPSVLQMLRDSSLSELCYAYKIRTKPEAKLLEKVQRKRQNKPDYSLESITDVVGLRLVGLFRTDMVDIFEGLLSAVMHTNGLSPNPFIKGEPDEMIIYKGINVFDEMPSRLKEIAARLCPNLSVIEEHSKEGYSSVHLVTRLNTAPKQPPVAGYKVPIEIQIRSVFEDAWGEIDHKYGYVIRTGKDTGKPINNPEFVLAHLKVLKRFSDACMEYADVIKTEAVGMPASILAARRVVPVTSDVQILERLRSLGVAEDILQKYAEAREVRVQAAKSASTDVSAGNQLYIRAAEQFRELVNQVEYENSLGEKLAYYYMKMNEALCLMSTNERDQVVAAHGIYQNLESTFSEHPLLLMRYGQALGKLGILDLAIENLRKSGEVAKKLSVQYAGKAELNWPDEMPHIDYEHIILSQPKLLGYHLWLKIKTLGPDAEGVKGLMFLEAYKITKMGLETAEENSKQELSLHNNLLYYALGAFIRHEREEMRGQATLDELKNQIREHVRYIEVHGKELNELPTSTIDSLMKAYSILGLKKEATKVGEILIAKCLKQDNIEFDANEKLQIIALAHKVVGGGDVGLFD